MGFVLSYSDFVTKGEKKSIFKSAWKERLWESSYQSPQYHWQGNVASSPSGLQISFLLNGWNAGEGKGRETPTFSLFNREPQHKNHSLAEIIRDWQ